MRATVESNPREEPSPPPVSQGQRLLIKNRGAPGWSCLLVSNDQPLLGRMRHAARSAGWATIECRAPEESVRVAVLNDFPLALIDLGEGAQRRETYDDLLRVLEATAGNLVVVCDRDANAEVELWSRQRGAWMYLPSVDEESDLARICREAMSVTEKLRGPAVGNAPARTK